jgi:hypothetical protein
MCIFHAVCVSTLFFVKMRIHTDIVTLALDATHTGDSAEDFLHASMLPAQPTGIASHCFDLLVYILPFMLSFLHDSRSGL